MPVSMNNTQIVFNDATVQDTAATGFASGTLMLFQQTSAPTGWTKQTTHDNKALRVVSGTASSGGTTNFTSVFVNQAPAVGATTLTTAQIPSHTHNYGRSAYGGSQNNTVTAAGTRTSTNATDATGGGGSHTHTGGTVTLNVQYVDLIIASKN